MDVDDVMDLHAQQLSLLGGMDGLRDRGLLESAVAQAQATFGGQYLHATIAEMAAAYLFHIVQNHPFVDGNKRTGLHAALVFLKDNDVVASNEDSERLYELTMAVAENRMTKESVAECLAAMFDQHTSR